MGLPMDLYRMEVMEWYGRANILKAGIVFTDMATTVSPRARANSTALSYTM